MKIECQNKRDGGTHATIDGVSYHFAPQPDGAHVADVEDRDHIQRFLSVRAYRIYEKAEGQIDPEVVKQDDQEVVDQTEDEQNDGDDKDDDVVDAERAALVDEYVQKFGRKPNHRASNDTIRKQLTDE